MDQEHCLAQGFATIRVSFVQPGVHFGRHSELLAPCFNVGVRRVHVNALSFPDL